MKKPILRYFLIGAASTIIGLAGIQSCNRGYSGDCKQAIEPEKKEFIEICNKRTDQTLYDGSLEKVLEARDSALEEANCELGKELWMCGKYSTDGTYKARFQIPY